MLDWSLPIETCLNYDDTIALYRHTPELVFVDGTGRIKEKVRLAVADSTTIRELAKAVTESLYLPLNEDGVISELELAFNHSSILNNNDTQEKTVKECGIRHGDELTVTYKLLHDEHRMRVHVRMCTGHVVNVFCQPDWSIHELKKQIHSQEGFSVKDQRLIFDASRLDDELTLMDYDIENKTVLEFYWEARGGGGNFADMEKV